MEPSDRLHFPTWIAHGKDQTSRSFGDQRTPNPENEESTTRPNPFFAILFATRYRRLQNLPSKTFNERLGNWDEEILNRPVSEPAGHLPFPPKWRTGWRAEVSRAPIEHLGLRHAPVAFGVGLEDADRRTLGRQQLTTWRACAHKLSIRWLRNPLNHHPRNPGMISKKTPTNKWFPHGFKVVQDFVHPHSQSLG